MKKRILALALCLALVLGMAAPVYAEETPPAPDGVEVTAEPDASVEEPVEESPAPTPEPSPAPGEEPTETEIPAPTEEPVDPTPECDCGAQDGIHAETCPLHIAPTESPEPSIDADALRASLLSLESEEAIYAFVEGLSVEEYEALVSVLTEDDILALATRCGISLEEVVITPPKSYTEVGPLSPSVTVAGGRVSSMLRTAPDEPENGLILNKQAVYDIATNLARITIEAYTTGTVTSSEQSVPADIVLVLDESGSMAELATYEYMKTYSPSSSTTCYIKNGDRYTQMFWCGGMLTHSGGWFTVSHFPFSHGGTQYVPMTSASDTASGHVQFYTQTSVSKQAALKAAATEFVEGVHADAIANNVDHRVSVIGFSSDNSSTIKIGLTGDIRANKGDSGNPASGTVLNAINQLGANGATHIEDGMTNAKTAFDNAVSTSATTRNRVVIVFTDGIPGSGTWSNTTINDSANPAIATSSQIKNTYGATVYTIGMLDDADPELPISDAANDAARTNKFLHYLSSNYPNATSMSRGGTEGDNKGYYLSAGDTESLSTIFEKISDEIATPAIGLGAETLIQDVVSQYFDMPAGIGAVTVETYDCLSFDGATGSATWSTSGVTLSDAVALSVYAINVTGFDFSKNFVSQMPKPGTTADRGKKIVIMFTVTPREGFWGGDGVPTNGDTSGVYADGNLVELFEVPKVNVPLNVPGFIGNKVNVYYGGDSPEPSTLYTPLAMPTGDDAWKADFVTQINYTVPSEPVSTAQDGTYTVSMTASSGSQTQTKTATATVRVFLPQFAVTAQDVWADYNVHVPLAQWCLVRETDVPKVAVTWMRDGIPSTAIGITMANSEPASSDYTFTFAAAETNDGTLTGNTYTIGELDADFNVGLISCTVGSTSYTVPPTALTVTKAVDVEDNHDFTVHINKFKMTIQKTFIDGAAVYKQDCIFTVSSGGTSFKVVVPAGSGTETVVGLVCGKEYTVTEDGSWSWRYTANGNKTVTYTTSVISNTQPTEISLTNPVEIANTLTNDKWLSGKGIESNVFAAKGRRRAAKEEG